MNIETKIEIKTFIGTALAIGVFTFLCTYVPARIIINNSEQRIKATAEKYINDNQLEVEISGDRAYADCDHISIGPEDIYIVSGTQTDVVPQYLNYDIGDGKKAIFKFSHIDIDTICICGEKENGDQVEEKIKLRIKETIINSKIERPSLDIITGEYRLPGTIMFRNK